MVVIVFWRKHRWLWRKHGWSFFGGEHMDGILLEHDKGIDLNCFEEERID